MPLRTAFRLCPHAVFLPLDLPAYARISHRAKKEHRHFSHVLEDVGLDEAFIDISDFPETSFDIGRAVKERIKAATGLTCSVGIGPNKLLAKLATDLGKPDGLVVLTESDIPTRICPLPVDKLLGVGPKTAAHLQRLGVGTIGALANVPLVTLIAHFGDVHGRYLHEAARGIDDSRIITMAAPVLQQADYLSTGWCRSPSAFTVAAGVMSICGPGSKKASLPRRRGSGYCSFRRLRNRPTADHTRSGNQYHEGHRGRSSSLF